MKTIKLHRFTLSNSFHNTETRVLSRWRDGETSQHQVWGEMEDEANREYYSGPARARLNRARRALCGMSDCTCGTVR